jgi:predicted nucleotidyltransferase
MNAVGVIVEYNPFHNGHSYHVQKAREETGADLVIAVMSGNFLQRGEPALVSKWFRAEMALKGGVDIVFELPYQFAVQKADTFAKGAVEILYKAGCKSICFGSESGSVAAFQTTLNYIKKHNNLFQQQIKHHIEKGLSYPKAMSLAYQDLPADENTVDLTKPNNILGLQYMKAIEDGGFGLKAYTIKRKNADHHDEHFASQTIASATSIRNALFSKKSEMESIKQYVPEHTYELLNQYLNDFGQLHNWENYWPYLRYKLLQSNKEELKTVYEVEEGLENRLISFALHAESFMDFMEKVKTKRYTWTRLQRTCVHILTNTKKTEMNQTEVSYLRLLGMTERGRAYLNKLKHHLDIPIVSKLSSFSNSQIELDIRSSRIYALGAGLKFQTKLLHTEFHHPPIYLSQNK